MIRNFRISGIFAACLAGSMLQGCSSLNVLAKLDGPYVPPSERGGAGEAALPQLADSAAVPEAAPEPAPALPASAAPTAPVLANVQTANARTASVGLAAVEPAQPHPTRVDENFLPADLVESAPPAPTLTRAEDTGTVLSPDVRLAAPEPAPALPAPAPASPPITPTENSELERKAEALGFSVVSALPTPGAPASQRPGAEQAEQYRAFFDFALARLGTPAAGGQRESMLLLDPSSLDPALQTCGNLPPAILLDLDPANGLLPLVSSNRANPELADLLGQLRQRGVTVYWISGHGPGAARAIRQRLVESALDPAGSDPLIVTRFAGESKQERRYMLGETNCLLAILGDNRGDFDELYDFVLDPIMAAPLEGLVDNGWFLAPPPLN